MLRKAVLARIKKMVLFLVICTFYTSIHILTDLINALPGNSSVNTVQHITVAVFSVDPTDAPIDWLDSDHVIYVYCRYMSVPRLFK
jgi:hypothetical protein